MTTAYPRARRQCNKGKKSEALSQRRQETVEELRKKSMMIKAFGLKPRLCKVELKIRRKRDWSMTAIRIRKSFDAKSFYRILKLFLTSFTTLIKLSVMWFLINPTRTTNPQLHSSFHHRKQNNYNFKTTGTILSPIVLVFLSLAVLIEPIVV